MSHTQGRWKSVGTAMKMSNFDKTYRVAVTVDNGKEGIEHIRSTVAYGVSASRNEAEANARLVAAAPSLLMALRDLYQEVKRLKIETILCAPELKMCLLGAEEVMERMQPSRTQKVTR